MLQGFVITLREGLEAFLIVAISLAYLRSLAIYFTQVAPRCCGLASSGKRAYLTSDSYGAGGTATAC